MNKNWNELKKYLKNEIEKSTSNREYFNGMCFISQKEAIYIDILNKMQELENKNE